MTGDFDPRDDLTDRLRALGQRPVDPALQSEHLTAMAGVRSGSAFRTSLLGRAKVAAGVMAGFLIGATGLTTAGAMGPLQPISADVVEAVTPLKELPGSASAKAKEAREKGAAAKDVDGKDSIGTERDWSDDCAPVEEGGATYAGNRGRYLKQERAKGADAFEAAKASTCGKPIAADDDATAGDDAPELEAPKSEDTEGDEPKGKDSAPGLADDAQRGQSEDKKPESSGKSDEAPEGGKPESAPAVPDVANDKADESTDGAPGTTPGDPEAKPEV
jgi:hypothetical protein